MSPTHTHTSPGALARSPSAPHTSTQALGVDHPSKPRVAVRERQKAFPSPFPPPIIIIIIIIFPKHQTWTLWAFHRPFWTDCPSSPHHARQLRLVSSAILLFQGAWAKGHDEITTHPLPNAPPCLSDIKPASHPRYRVGLKSILQSFYFCRCYRRMRILPQKVSACAVSLHHHHHRLDPVLQKPGKCNSRSTLMAACTRRLASPFGPHPKRRIDGKAARIICPFLPTHQSSFHPSILQGCSKHAFRI